MLSINDRFENDTLLLSLVGKLDFEVTAILRDRIRDAVNTLHPRLVVINFSGITFIDSSGLGLLVAGRNSLEKYGGTLVICGLVKQVRKTFEQTNLLNYFPVFEEEGQAMAFVKKVVEPQEA